MLVVRVDAHCGRVSAVEGYCKWPYSSTVASRCMLVLCLQAQAFAGWLDYVSWSKRNRLVVGRALAKLRYGVLASTFFAWVDAVDQSHVEAQITTKEGLQVQLTVLQQLYNQPLLKGIPFVLSAGVVRQQGTSCNRAAAA